MNTIALSQPTRLPLLDAARGIALVAMAIYHFGWDLAFFGYVDPQSVNEGPWKYFARSIASSFLILVGISLILAHSEEINWRRFWPRWFKIAAAAAVITIATFYFDRGGYIFFGILHQIAFASIAGLLFIRLPSTILIALGFVVFIIGQTIAFDELNGLNLAWTGLPSEGIRSNDYVPVFPWFSAVLIGMGFCRPLLTIKPVLTLNASAAMNAPTWRILRFLGRHSLIVYLAHQPILIGLIYLYSLIWPANPF